MAPAQKGKRQRDDSDLSELDIICEINAKTPRSLSAQNTRTQFEALATAIWKGEENGNDEAFQSSLKEAAAFLLACTINTTTATTSMSPTSFRIIEVEAYFLGGAGYHEDTFTHAFPEQGTAGQWYFHRVTPTGGFKGGTFKGMDITFGNGAVGGKHFGGFLIRSILPVGATSPVIVEGPSLVVDKLLSSSSCPTVSEFVSTRKVTCVSTSPMTLTFQPDKWSTSDKICASPRVGLVPRKPTDLFYAARPYRFHVINPSSVPSIAKVRGGIVSALLAKGVPVEKLPLLTGGQKQLVLKLESLMTPLLSEPLRKELKLTIEAAISAQRKFELEQTTSSNNTHLSKGAAAAFAEKLTAHVFKELEGQMHLKILKDVLGGDVKDSTVIAKLVTIAALQNQYPRTP